MADTIYHNGSILTMAGKVPTYVEALAVKDGTIVFTGSKDQAFAMKGDATKVVDLGGKAVGINIARADRTASYLILAENLKTLVESLKPQHSRSVTVDVGG